MLTKYLYIAGCMPFLLLGLLHTAYTIADTYNPKRLIPYKSGVMGLMKESTLALTKETDMWRMGWVQYQPRRRSVVFRRYPALLRHPA